MAAVAIFIGVTLWSGSAVSQEERPQISPGERKVPRKKDAEPRAVGVLRLNSAGKTSLVPIAILVNGKFWDASAYKADPVPMALEPGVVYEAERTGSSQGLFTVGAALHSNAVNAPTPWIGTGVYVPHGSEKPSPELKTTTITPVGIDNAEGPPRLTRTPGAATPPAGSPPATTPPASTPPSGRRSDDEPPRLSKPASTPSSPPSPGDSKGSSSPNAPGSTPQAPAASTAQTEKKATEPVPASDSGAGEANRPRLRRGKPAESFADEDVPGYSRPGSTPAKSTIKAEAAAPEAPSELIPAISDAAGPQPHSYTFEWLKDEEGERRKQITDLAKQQLRAYVEARAKARITPAAQSHTQHQAAAKKSPDPILENVKVIAYDLWGSNQPVMIFSADAHMPPPATGSQAGTEADLQYSVTLVAYPDMYNNMHKIYSGITDRFHLDVTPRLELVDAVDADGDGRGELLFRETSDAGSGWIIYRATADKLWKMYDSLNPE
ncbi:MAG TPA: hypothetical protein VKV39_19665 [Candidatus Sulfotelmatobacter sp.]|nr:hypothetical protein [Candidatus Sulfotelmatobacter sp.]